VSGTAFTFEGIAAPPSRGTILREAMAIACRRLEARGKGPDREPGACNLLEDGSALIRIAERPSALGGPARTVQIAIRVKAPAVAVRGAEPAGPQSVPAQGGG